MPGGTKDLAGQQFGQLHVVGRGPNDKHGNAMWNCVCSCGQKTTVVRRSLITGNTKSCGCGLVAARKAASVTHGLYKMAEYKVWISMKQRCTNPKVKNFNNYGGRGIAVCDRWINSFEAFLADVGPRPSSKHWIERVNNDGNYEPANCTWATAAEQLKNRRPYSRRKVA